MNIARKVTNCPNCGKDNSQPNCLQECKRCKTLFCKECVVKKAHGPRMIEYACQICAGSYFNSYDFDQRVPAICPDCKWTPWDVVPPKYRGDCPTCYSEPVSAWLSEIRDGKYRNKIRENRRR